MTIVSTEVAYLRDEVERLRRELREARGTADMLAAIIAQEPPRPTHAVGLTPVVVERVPGWWEAGGSVAGR